MLNRDVMQKMGTKQKQKILLSECKVSVLSESCESTVSENELICAASSMSWMPKANAAARLLPISCTTLAAACSTGLEKLRKELSSLNIKCEAIVN